jgi:hypothetical protein
MHVEPPGGDGQQIRHKVTRGTLVTSVNARDGCNESVHAFVLPHMTMGYVAPLWILQGE